MESSEMWQCSSLTLWSGTSQVKRIVILSNNINLESSSSARGIVVAGSGTSMNFLQVVVRKNVIRDVTYPSSVTSGMVGINIANVEQAIVEDNVINNCATTTAVIFNSTKVQSMKSFNNQNTAGALMRAYDSATSRSIPELADAAQDSLMVF